MVNAILFAGPSGAGKTSLIENIAATNPDFEHVFLYMTRPLRDGEKGRETKTREELKQMYENGEVLYLIEKHGVLFGLSTLSLYGILNRGKIPMVEMAIYDIDVFRRVHEDVLVIYVAPPSKELLGDRLLRDGRSNQSNRQSAGFIELDEYNRGKFDDLIDLRIINQEGRIEESAERVVRYFKTQKEIGVGSALKSRSTKI